MHDGSRKIVRYATRINAATQKIDLRNHRRIWTGERQSLPIRGQIWQKSPIRNICGAKRCLDVRTSILSFRRSETRFVGARRLDRRQPNRRSGGVDRDFGKFGLRPRRSDADRRRNNGVARLSLRRRGVRLESRDACAAAPDLAFARLRRRRIFRRAVGEVMAVRQSTFNVDRRSAGSASPRVRREAVFSSPPGGGASSGEGLGAILAQASTWGLTMRRRMAVTTVPTTMAIR